MEISSAIYALAGSIGAATIAGLIGIYTHRNSLAQSQRDSLLKLSTEAATTEYRTDFEIAKINGGGPISPYHTYFIFHTVFLHEILGGNKFIDLNDRLIESAYNRAKQISKSAPVKYRNPTNSSRAV